MKGLVKALQIDGSDLSVSYKRSGIDSEHKLTIDDILDLYNDDPENISVNTGLLDDYFTYITKDGEELHASEHILPGDDNFPLLLKINPQNQYSEIIISMQYNFEVSADMPLMGYFTLREHGDRPVIHLSDIDGYNNTLALYDMVRTDLIKKDTCHDERDLYETMTQSIKPVMYCLDKKWIHDSYQGYVPAIKEMLTLYRYIGLVNLIRNHLKQPEMDFDNLWHTSTVVNSEMNTALAVNIDGWRGDDKPRPVVRNIDMLTYANVLPFYKKVN